MPIKIQNQFPPACQPKACHHSVQNEFHLRASAADDLRYLSIFQPYSRCRNNLLLLRNQIPSHEPPRK